MNCLRLLDPVHVWTDVTNSPQMFGLKMMERSCSAFSLCGSFCWSSTSQALALAAFLTTHTHTHSHTRPSGCNWTDRKRTRWSVHRRVELFGLGVFFFLGIGAIFVRKCLRRQVVAWWRIHGPTSACRVLHSSKQLPPGRPTWQNQRWRLVISCFFFLFSKLWAVFKSCRSVGEARTIPSRSLVWWFSLGVCGVCILGPSPSDYNLPFCTFCLYSSPEAEHLQCHGPAGRLRPGSHLHQTLTSPTRLQLFVHILLHIQVVKQQWTVSP